MNLLLEKKKGKEVEAKIKVARGCRVVAVLIDGYVSYFEAVASSSLHEVRRCLLKQINANQGVDLVLVGTKGEYEAVPPWRVKKDAAFPVRAGDREGLLAEAGL